MTIKTSVIIPTYNEEKVIENCLQSLTKQTYKPLEIIVVDDGSKDKTVNIIENLKLKIMHSQELKSENLKLFRQEHKGPGPARNFGAQHAKGEILVFIDADMTFDKNFIKDLTAPIISGKTMGTFSKNEFVANKNNIWSICWNINRNVPKERMLPKNFPDKAPVFRAILKKEFDKVKGFDATGEYTDDWSLSRKLGKKSTVVKGAIYYHSNPSNLIEVYNQARWIGKNEFISGHLLRKARSLIQYSLPASLVLGLTKSFLNFNLLVQRSFSEVIYFLIFKLVYDWAIFTSVIKSFFKEDKAK